MPFQPLTVPPGVISQFTEAMANAKWWISQLIRWDRTGLLQKIGGWARICSTPLEGTGRGMHSWADLSGNDYVAVGTEQQLALFFGGTLYDISPIRQTRNISPDFSTLITSNVVTIKDTANGASVGDWINLVVPVSVGGIVLQGYYQIQSIIDDDDYTIKAASVATGTVSHGGAVPAFTTTMTSPNVSVALANHGLMANSQFEVQVATTVSTLTLGPYTSYNVNSVTDTNNFVIAPGGTAAAGATVDENGGNALIQYRIPTGLASAVSGAYGTGIYGEGIYGSGSSTLALRQWFLDNWGQNLIGNYTGSTIYQWVPPIAEGNVAAALTGTDIPQMVNESFVSGAQQIMVALGCDPPGGGTQDAMLVRWCDVSDNTDWLASATNQAGSFRLSKGSKIVGGLAAPNFDMLWTDVGVWLMVYSGYPFVYSFTNIAGGSGLLSARAAGVYDSKVYWVNEQNFQFYDGASVQHVPCTVADQFFQNFQQQQQDKIWCWVNSLFREIWWLFPSIAGNGECDSYVKLTLPETGGEWWDYGALPRTCGLDASVYGNPLATDTSGLVQQHEVGNDADGQAMMPYAQTGWYALEETTYSGFIERMIADFVLTGGTAPNNRVFYQLYFADYPTDTPNVYGPYVWTPQGPAYSIVRGRGRLVSFRFYSTDLGVAWRLGRNRYNTAPAGRR